MELSIKCGILTAVYYWRPLIRLPSIKGELKGNKTVGKLVILLESGGTLKCCPEECS